MQNIDTEFQAVSSKTKSVGMIEQRRKREDFDAATSEKLENAWAEGLRSTKKEEEEKIMRLSEETGISKERIEVWIGNRRAKDRRGGVGAVSVKPRPVKRGPTAYTLFSQQFKRGETSKEDHLKEVGRKWSSLGDTEKQRFKEESKMVRAAPLKGMDKEVAIDHHMKLIENSVGILDSLGMEVMLIAMEKESAPHLFGSDKGLRYISRPDVQESFRRAVFGETVYIAQCKKGKQELREEVRRLINTCWKNATGGKRPAPYSALLKGTSPWKLEGLPDGLAFKEPSCYGLSSLQRILKNKDSIKFVKHDNHEASEVISQIISESASLETVHDLTAASADTDELPANKETVGSVKIIETGDTGEDSPEIPLELVDCLSGVISIETNTEQTSNIVSLLPEADDSKKEKKERKRKAVKKIKEETSDNKPAKSSKKQKMKKFEIEYLVDDRENDKGATEYLVHWKNYSEKDRTWEPVEEMPNTMLSMYWKKKNS